MVSASILIKNKDNIATLTATTMSDSLHQNQDLFILNCVRKAQTAHTKHSIEIDYESSSLSTQEDYNSLQDYVQPNEDIESDHLSAISTDPDEYSLCSTASEISRALS